MSSTRNLLMAAAGCVLVFAALVSREIVGRRAAIAIDDIGQELAAFVAVIACWRARRRTSGRTRRGWVVLGAGLGIWCVGQAIWITIEVVRGQIVPSPSVADLAFLTAVPVVAAGLVLICFPSSRALDILRTVLDALLIVISLLLIAYVVALQRMITESPVGGWSVIVSLIYPVGDAMLVTVVLVAISQASWRARPHLLVLLAGFACMTFSDSRYAMSTVTGTYRTGSILDSGWTASFLLIAVAAIGFVDPLDRKADDFETAIQAAAPYVVLLVALGVVAQHFAVGGRTDVFIRWTALLTCALTAIGLIVHRHRWRRAEMRQAHQMTHDQLTNLANMTAVTARLDELLADGAAPGVLYFEIDRLADVNTSLGRAAGDGLLCAVADRLQGCLPESCVAGRVASDEFVVIDAANPDADRLNALAARIDDALAAPLSLQGHQFTMTASIGLSSCRAGHQRGDELLRESQDAMRRAKRNGPGRVEIFDPTADRPWTLADLTMEGDLRKALCAGDGLVPHFQPIVRLSDLSVVGHEALIRWNRSGNGLLMPGSFLPVAEQTGLIVPLGWWMLNTCGQTMAASGDLDKSIAVNVAGTQLGRGELVPALERVVSRYGIEPRQIHIEVTESQLVTPTPVVRAELDAVAQMGVVIALDDFGTGYSSLTLLRDLPVGIVKIDRTFVSPLLEEGSARAIVASVIRLCDDLGIEVVAEGVELQAQADLLGELGCSHAQGFLFGVPGPSMQQVVVAAVPTVHRGDGRR
ncbi:MAG: phosphodiesterase [Ilumatobacteraceae bacterium]|nr:phosphodiesterase [Ilumatobacteraceae bacterium]